MDHAIRMRLSVLGVASAVVMTTAAPAVAQSELRTAWGAPDLQGVWDFRTLTPMERPDASSGNTIQDTLPFQIYLILVH